MGATLPKPLTLEAFLDWQRKQDLRYKFDRVRVAGTAGEAERSFCD